MGLFPVMLQLHDKNVVVIGGGKVASRKTASLVEAGARVTVVAPELTPSLAERHRRGEIEWRKKCFDPKDLHGAWMVVAATDRPDVNRQVAEQADPHQLVNVVDRPERGNMQFPARLSRGRLTIAVSTGGASPLLARRICRELASVYDASFADCLDDLYERREQLKREIGDPNIRKEALDRLVSTKFREREKPRNR